MTDHPETPPTDPVEPESNDLPTAIVRQILRAQLEIVRHEGASVTRQGAVDSVHDFRVAMRRTRVALKVYRPWLPKRARRLRDDLARLAEVTGSLRDLDVLTERIRSERSRAPEGRFRALLLLLDEHREAARKRLEVGLARPRFARMLRAWSDLSSVGPAEEPSAADPARLAFAAFTTREALSVFDRLTAETALFDDRTDDDRIHALRIEAKKLRYLLEFLTSFAPSAQASAVISRLKRLQDHLGAYQDLRVQAARLREIAAIPGAPLEARLEAVRLAARWESRRLRSRQGVGWALRRFTGAANLRRLRRLESSAGAGARSGTSGRPLRAPSRSTPLMLVLLCLRMTVSPPAARAQADCLGDDLARSIACLEARVTNPGNASRMERRWVERGLALHILERDSTNVPALSVAAKWELDELFWQAQNASRFRTRYFERRRDAAVERLRAYLDTWQAAAPDDPAPLRQAARLDLLLQDWRALETTGAILVERFPERPDGHLLLGVAAAAGGAEGTGDAAFALALCLMDPMESALWLDPARFAPGFDVRDAEDLSAIAAGDAARTEPDARAAESFWAVRDPRLLTPENERRTAHMARMAMADLLFGEGGGPRGWLTLQGDLVVRYGLPYNPLVTTAPYGTLSDVTGASSMEGARKMWAFPDLDQPLLLWDRFRNGTMEFYSPPASAYSMQPGATSMGGGGPDFELVARSLFRDRPESYVHRTPGREVAFPHVISQVRGEGGRTRLVAAFGIPVKDVRPGTGSVPVNLDTGFFLVAGDGVAAARRRPFTGLPGDGIMHTGVDTLWTGVLELEARPGRFATSMEFETSDRSALGFSRDSLTVRGFVDGGLALSDLLFARQVLPAEGPATATAVTIGDLAVHPVPWRVFPRIDPVLLVFQVYGLEVGPDGTARYGIEAVMDRAERPSLLGRIGRLVTGADPTAVSVSFDATAAGPDDTNSFMLDASNVEPGTYRVTVRVTDLANGRTVTNEAIARLIESEAASR